MAHESDAASLIEELRHDTELDAEHELAALARVESRLMLRLIEGGQDEQPQTPPSRARQPRRMRWWRSARGGMAAALLVGTALGAGGHAAVSFVVSRGLVSSPEYSERKARPALAPGPPKRSAIDEEAMTASVPEPAVAPPLEVGDLPLDPQPAPPQASVTPPSIAGGLELELSELEVARRAVLEADGATALRTLARHARRYPGSVLAQERDALTVKALVLSGRHHEARQLGAGFRARHPHSMLLDSVERALASIP